MPTNVSSYVGYEPATSGSSAKTATPAATVATVTAWRVLSDTANDRLSEEARGPDGQDEQDDQQRDREQELGRHEADVAQQQVERHAEQEPADDGPDRALDPADDGGRERVEEDALHQVRRQEVDGRDEHPGDGAEQGGEAPADREHPRDAHAEQAARLGRERGRAQREAELREAEEAEHDRHERQADADRAELVDPDGRAAADVGGAARERARHELDLRPPD